MKLATWNVNSLKVRLPHLADWLAKTRDWLRQESGAFARLVVVGDFNIAPDARDVHDPAACRARVPSTG